MDRPTTGRPNLRARECYSGMCSGSCRMLLGYHDTRDVVSLYGKGAGGLQEFLANLKDEVLYGFLYLEGRRILINYVNESVRYTYSDFPNITQADSISHGCWCSGVRRGLPVLPEIPGRDV